MLAGERKLRINFLTYRPALSGGARVIGDYAAYLLRQGHDVRVFAQPEEPPPLLRRLKARLQGKPDWRPRRSPFFEPLGDRFIRLPQSGAPRTKDIPDADVVVANFWITASWVASLPASKGAKVYFMQDYGAAGQPIEDVRKTWALGLKTITVSRYLQNEIARVSGARAALVPNGVDPVFLIAQERPARRGPPVVGFLYSNNVMKGSSVCIEAVKQARKTLPELRVLSFGPKPPSEAALLPDFIELKSNVSEEEARAIYGACDAWLFGSIREGFGLPILEAMAARTPVIAAQSAAAPDILSLGGGRLAPVSDAEAMAAAITEICQLPADEWRAMSNAAYRTAQTYSLDAARQRFEAALVAAAQDRFEEIFTAA
ncbi:MAG: glycosyltransferase family 4 protein [Parvularculaceae bacterium]|nr:glycosyltransferase family 4 protein [Parvularculaceae bacterium]